MTDPLQAQDEALAAEWAQALEEQASPGDASGGAGTTGASSPAPAGRRVTDFAPAALEDLQAEPAVPPREVSLDAILDIPVSLSMEIGRTRINIRHLLQLNQGSVVELDRLAGEPLDVLVNGTLIAHGEVVVVNEKFGIRLTDVISTQERVQKLR
jgi:flagellar motor switch protein FliN/FliY